MARPLIPSLAVALCLGCGDPAGPGSGTDAQLLAVNGAAYPVLAPGQEAVLTGRGFGGSAEGRTVLVSTGGGLAEAPPVTWSDNAVTVSLPDGITSGALHLVRADGDTLGPVPIFVRDTATFDPATLTWKAGPALPEAYRGAGGTMLSFPADGVLSQILVLVAGARDGGGLSDSAWFGFGAADGGIDRWLAAPQDSVVPPARVHPVVVAADRATAPLSSELTEQFIDAVVYLIGGMDSLGRVLAEVHGMGVGRAGEYGLWTPLTALPRRRAGASAVAALGKVVVAGGFGADSLSAREVFVASVDTLGLLNGWFAGPDLPEGRAFGTLIHSGSHLYYLGGQTGAVNPDSTDRSSPDLRNTVWTIALSPVSGFFADSAWATLTPLNLARARHAAFAFDNGILVTGGAYAGAAAAGESEFAAFAGAGALGAFAAVGAPSIAGQSGGALRDMVYAVGRDGAGLPHPVIVGGRTDTEAAVPRVWWH